MSRNNVPGFYNTKYNKANGKIYVKAEGTKYINAATTNKVCLLKKLYGDDNVVLVASATPSRSSQMANYISKHPAELMRMIMK